jgi:hypothetical protein
MKPLCLSVPILAIGAVACGGSPSTATIHLDARTGWIGTAEVLVHTASGDMVSRTTLAAGDNDVDLDDGDTVTIATSDGTNRQLETAFAVQRGDVLYAQANPPWPDGYHDVTIQIPAVANVDAYDVEQPDGSSYGPDTPDAYVLPDRTTLPVLVGAFDVDDHPLALFGDAAAPIVGDAIDLSTHVPIDLSTVTLNVTGAPAGASLLAGSAAWVRDEQVSVPAAAPSPVMVEVPDGFGDVRSISVFADASSSAIAVVEATSRSFPAQLDVDLSQVAVPDLSAASYDGTRVTWTAGNGDFDGYFGGLQYQGDSTWILFAPAGATDLTLPALPADLAPTATPDSGFLYAFSYDGLAYDDYLAGPVAPRDGDRWELRATEVTIAGATAAPAAIRHARLERGMREALTRRRPR